MKPALCISRPMKFIRAAMIVVVLATTAAAQDNGAAQRQPDGAGRRSGTSRPSGLRGDHRPHRDRQVPRGGIAEGLPFEPTKEDLGPLRPEEQSSFDEFARARMPIAYQALRELRERDPAAFGRRMDEIAPRFRFMQRMLKEDPQLGENVLAHAENLQAMRQNARLLRDPQLRPFQRRRLLAETRQRILDNVWLEADVREERLRQRERAQPTDLENQLRTLTDPNSNPDEAPQEIRPLLERWRNADPEERERIRDRLRQRLAQRQSDEISRQREQIQKLRDGADAETERRLQRLLEPPEKPDAGAPRPERRPPRQKP